MELKPLSLNYIVADYSVAEVVIEVGDVNDNAPVFIHNPVIVGVKDTAAFNDPIIKLQVSATTLCMN